MASLVNHRGYSLAVLLGVVDLVLLLLIGMGVIRAPSQLKAPSSSSAEREHQAAEFDAAVRRARDPRPEDVVHDLIALAPGSPDLQWHPAPNAPNAKVLVATLTDYDGYKPRKQGCKLKKEVWVTPVPQLEQACRAFHLSGPALHQRTAQYLGLRPDNRGKVVVEMWVRPADVFRPCPDREVTDRECGLGLPPASAQDSDQQKYASWFGEELAKKYFGEKTYPWTRLGYTYDWGNPERHIGASEYVIPSGTEVSVAAVADIEAYCAARPPFTRDAADDGAAADDC